MIQENQKLFNQLNMLLDGLIVGCSMLLAYWVRFYVLDGYATLPFVYYVITAIVIAPIYVIGFAFCGLYRSQRKAQLSRAIVKMTLVEAVCAAGMMLAFFGLKIMDISRLALLLHVLLSWGLLTAKRACVFAVLHHYREKGYNQRHAILIGSGALAERYRAALAENAELGIQLDGYVGPRRADRADWLGDYDRLEELLSTTNCDEAIAALEAGEFETMKQIIDSCEKTDIGNLPLINIRRIPLDNLGNAFLKRAVDIVGALVLILLTSPLMLAAAIGTKLSSAGPIIFRQQRVGKGKKNFTMYKFRSMRINAAQETGWTTDGDSRKTKFGALLRKTSIDELPQFFNVLKGDMSLVGPRPEVPFYVEQFREEIPLYMVKHQVRPGITGWAQVKGFRGDTSIQGRIEHDIFYIENWSLEFDLKILFMTVFGGLVNKEKLA
ncbi:MAG: sugar transferase [Pseudoflavonifractor sp.]